MKGTRSGVVLFSVAALALAMTGILYAHWTDTLEVNAQVAVGAIDPQWTIEGTSDDGLVDSFSNEFRDPTEYVYPGRVIGTSSADQTYVPLGPGNLVLIDLTKDVATCAASLERDSGSDPNDGLRIIIENGYPSYWCQVKADLHNFGSVPVKLQFIGIDAYRNGTAVPVTFGSPNGFQYSVDADLDGGPVDLELSIAAWDPRPVSLDCGYQLDPGEDSEVFVDFSFHVDQDAMQGATYELFIQYEWWNWNEYSEDRCRGPV
jgi:hypothetical protein